MSTITKEAEETKQSRQGRSPAYPIVPLGKAIERVREFYKVEGKNLVPIFSAYKAWGYGGKSSGARQTASSLKQYGLIEYEGGGENLKTRLTDAALKIILDKQDVSPERDKLIKEAALTPAILRELYDNYKSESGIALPSDNTLETILVRDKDYNESAAKHLISVFKDTISDANLDKPDNLSHYSKADDDDAVKLINIGDLVQVEINGIIHPEKAARVRAIKEHEGEKWVLIEGSNTGFPMKNVMVVEKGKPPAGFAGWPGKFPTFNDAPPLTENMRKEITSLDEGEATLIWPEKLSADSYHDLEHWVKGILKKAKRLSGVTDTPNNPDSIEDLRHSTSN